MRTLAEPKPVKVRYNAQSRAQRHAEEQSNALSRTYDSCGSHIGNKRTQ